MLIINVGIFLKWFVNFSVNTVAVRANSKLQFFWCSSPQNPFPNSYYQINRCLASYHMLRFTSASRPSFSTFHVRFIKITNVDKITNAFVKNSCKHC